MVQDIRNIVLSMDEILTAFEGYKRITPSFLPNAEILDCKIKDKGVVLTTESNQDNVPKRQEVAYQGIDVLKPLIRFCIENNIMLPRDGKKSILYEESAIIMHVELDLSQDMPTVVSPMQMSHAEKMPLKNEDAVRPMIIKRA